MLAEINTDLVPAEKRLEFWHDSIVRLFKLNPQVEALSSKAPFHAQLRLYKVDRLHLTASSGTPHKSIVTEVAQNDAFVVIVPMDGAMTIRQDDREAVLSPGSIGLCNLAHACEFISATDYQRVSINISGKDLREIFPACAQVTAVAINVENGAGAVFLDIVKSLHRWVEVIESQTVVAVALADAMLDSLRALLYSLPINHDVPHSRVEVYHQERIKSFVKANLRNNLSIDSIAQAVGLSGRHVHALFSHESLSLMKWVWAERLDHCRQDLASTALRSRSVSEIAYSWGFNDPAHFSRAFKNRFGMSPTHYREQALLPSPPALSSVRELSQSASH